MSRPTTLDGVTTALAGSFCIALALTISRAAGLTVLWENLHWTLAGMTAVAIARRGVARSEPEERALRALFCSGFVFWLLGQIAWDLQTVIGYDQVPAPSDVLFLVCGLPIVVALGRSMHGLVSRGEELSAYLDSATAFFALTSVILLIVGGRGSAIEPAALTVTAMYPIVYLATSAAGVIASVSIGAHVTTPRNLVLLGALGIHGVAWLAWMTEATTSAPEAGSTVGVVFSFSLLIAALSASIWRQPAPASQPREPDRVSSALITFVPLPAIVASVTVLLVGPHDGPFQIVEQAAATTAVLIAVVRQTLLLRERTSFVGRERARTRNQRRLLEINEELLRTASADAVLESIADTLVNVVPYDTLTIYLVDDEHHNLVPVLARDEFAGEILKTRIPWGGGITGHAVARGEAVLVNDAESDPRGSHIPGTDRAKEALIVVPLVGPDGVLGALNLYRQGRQFAAGELDLARLYASQAALALEAAHRHGRLSEAARTDALTGLLNRTGFGEAAERAISVAGSHVVAVLFLDLDGFKLVNDSLGHAAGDELLRAIADRLRSVVRPGDSVARMGGDEFAVVATVGSDRDAESIAGRMLDSLRAPCRVGSTELVVHASIGVSSFPLAATAVELLRNADAAMYEAKARGKDRYELFRAELHERAVARFDLERELRHAVDEGAFELHYQPLVDLTAATIIGHEALIRWPHPSRGLVMPGSFIGVAEETGLIVPLGMWVLREALRQVAEWRRDGWTGVMSVNVATTQLAERGLVAAVATLLAEFNVPADRLQLEITESAALGRDAATRQCLHQLAELGMHLAVDDFGTGYSSLAHIADLPLTGLKIDRSFVAGLGTDRTRSAIVEASISFGRALGFRVTAEGIETADQRRRLTELGCEVGQGYLFGRPQPAMFVPRPAQRILSIVPPGAARAPKSATA